MERTASLLSLSSRSSSSDPDSSHSELLLPFSEKEWPLKRRVPRVRALLGNCLYRRLLIWAAAVLIIIGFALLHQREVSVSNVVEFVNPEAPTNKAAFSGQTSGNGGNERSHQQQAALKESEDGSGSAALVVEEDALKPTTKEEIAEGDRDTIEKDLIEAFMEQISQLDAEEDAARKEQFEQAAKKMPWLRFKHLDGFYHGIKSLVDKKKLEPEYPDAAHQAPLPAPPVNDRVPKPQPYSPYASSKGSDGAKTCYLDRHNKVPAPDLYAYDGVPQHMPDPALGSYDLFGIRDDICFDRFGRYGPYGLGYVGSEGGVGVGMETESEGNDVVWDKTGKIDYREVDWADAQERCQAANKHRFVEPQEGTGELPAVGPERNGKKARIAVVMRCYTGFKWTELAVLNLRAMINELALKSGGEYSVHILLHVRDDTLPIWSDDAMVQRVLDYNVPREFHGLVTLWSVSQMMLFYPGRFDAAWQNPSGQGIHGVYRSAHLPVQVFAMQHPEYEHFWNWEMDLRLVGNYYELFDRIGKWADEQPRSLMWERNERYYVPAYHGSWDNFTASVARDSGIGPDESAAASIVGPVWYEGKQPLRSEERGQSALPESCTIGKPAGKCGVGEGADLIALDPIFDVMGSGWVFSNDVTGYKNPSSDNPPRRASIVTAGRVSRRLLAAMHEEVWRYHRSMFTEMFATTIALHRALKAVYAPHPIYLDRAWQEPGAAVDAVFNSGEDRSTSGRNSPFDMRNEHNQKGTSFYYHSEFAGLLWRRWLGYPQMDGRGSYGGRSGAGTVRGGPDEETRKDSSGRMCLRSMLLHPIKHERPDE